jgi:hypothetical protein
MKRVPYLVIAFLLCSMALVQAQPAAAPNLHGVITDPSGAFIPGAIVQLLVPTASNAPRPTIWDATRSPLYVPASTRCE